ncbi:hypothetical protein FJZ48_01415 [Candidatus Uhrbacteria bacterium]|nr:hypothetical protein [Candidatus Uhrbacteria bacterium]
MPMFRPVIKKLPEQSKHIMTLIIVGGMMVAFLLLSIYQRLDRSEFKSLLPPGALTRHEITVEELPSLQQINPSFYSRAKSGDVVATYQDTIVLYRPATNQILSSRVFQP